MSLINNKINITNFTRKSTVPVEKQIIAGKVLTLEEKKILITNVHVLKQVVTTIKTDHNTPQSKEFYQLVNTILGTSSNPDITLLKELASINDVKVLQNLFRKILGGKHQSPLGLAIDAVKCIDEIISFLDDISNAWERVPEANISLIPNSRKSRWSKDIINSQSSENTFYSVLFESIDSKISTKTDNYVFLEDSLSGSVSENLAVIRPVISNRTTREGIVTAPAEFSVNRNNFKQISEGILKVLNNESINLNEYLDKLTDIQLVEAAMALFYYDNGTTPPHIYQIMLSAESPKRDRLIEYLDLLDFKMSQLNFSKKKRVFNNLENFNTVIQNSISSAKNFLNSYPSVSSLFKEADAKGNISFQIDKIAREISTLYRIANGNGQINTEDNFIPIATPAYCSNFFADSSTFTSQIITHENLTTRAAASTTLGTNLGAMLFAGVFMGFSLGSSNGYEFARAQEIGFLKNYLFQLAEAKLGLGDSLSPAEVKFIGKFLKISRGNMFGKVKDKIVGTTSLRKFNELTKTKIQREPTEIENFIDTRAKLKELLKAEKFDEINELISKKFTDEQKSLIPIMAFKLNGLRGNLLFHLLNSFELEKKFEKIGSTRKIYAIKTEVPIEFDYQPMLDSKKQTSKSRKELTTVLIELSKKHKLVKETIENDYEGLNIWFKNYKVTNKYDALIDMQHILLGIVLNGILTKEQKQDLYNTIKKELNRKSDGKFKITLTQRKANNIITSACAIGYEGFNIGGVQNATLQGLAGLGILDNALSWSVFSSLFPTIDYLSGDTHNSFNTTTFNSLQAMLSYNSYLTLEETATTLDSTRPGNIQLIEQLKISTHSEDKVLKEELLIQFNEKPLSLQTNNSNKSGEKAISPQYSTLGKIIDIIRLDLNSSNKNNGVRSSLDALEAVNPNLRYCILTDCINDKLIITTLSDKCSDTELTKLTELWSESVVAYLKVSQKDLFDEKGLKLSMKDFKKYIGSKQQFTNSTEALIKFYQAVVLIGLDDEKQEQRKINKIRFLDGVISRAEHDSTSSWYMLRKTSAKKEFGLKVSIRLIGATIWSVGSFILTTKVVISHGVALPLAIPTLCLANAIRGTINGAVNSLAYTNTPGYEEAKNILNLLAKSESLNRQLAKEIAEQRKLSPIVSCKYMKDIIDIYKALSSSNRITEIKYIFEKPHPKYIVEDNDIKNKLNKLKDTTINSLFEELTQIIIDLNDEVADKFLANEAIYRTVMIIKHSELDNAKKSSLLLKFYEMYAKGAMPLVNKISEHRSFIRKKNFMLGDAIGGAMFALPSIIGLGHFTEIGHLTGLSALEGGTDTLGIMTQVLGSMPLIQTETVSFKEGKEFILICLLDICIQMGNNPKFKEANQKKDENLYYLETIMFSLNKLVGKKTGFTEIDKTIKSLNDSLYPVSLLDKKVSA